MIVAELENIRGQIDKIDSDLVRLLAERFACSRKIATIKIGMNKAVFDAEREAELLEKIITKAQDEKLSPAIAKAIFDEILHQSRRVQESSGLGDTK